MKKDELIVFTLTEHNIETKSDCLRGIYKTDEGAQAKADEIKETYKKLTGFDDFNQCYILRIEPKVVE